MSILDTIKKAFGGQKAEEAKELPVSFYIDTSETERVEKDRFFRTHPYSPIEDRSNFTGLDYYPPDPGPAL